jgi:hypothetical protein
MNARTPMVEAHGGQLLLHVSCEICKCSVLYMDLVYNTSRDKYACPSCWDVWYTNGTARLAGPSQ